MSSILESARNTFRMESQAITDLEGQLTPDFEKAVLDIMKCTGKVIVTGMGKSGLIGRKIAATMASTGTPAFFLHPADAYHGDLGMISKADVILAISNSGQTDEILRLVPFLQENGNRLISMTGNPDSALARNSDYHLNIAVKDEACPMSLAPTSSTTATLAMGDALAIALITERGFCKEDFARFHPGGTIGRRLVTRVGDVMRSENLAIATADTKLSDVIIEISNARMGVAIIMEGKRIAGLVTDGDVRRAMQKYRDRFFDVTAGEVMTSMPKSVSARARITEAEEIMRRYKIHSLLVTGDGGELAGVVELYDMMIVNPSSES